MNVALVGASLGASSSSSNSNNNNNNNNYRPHHPQPPARPGKPRRNSNSNSSNLCQPHGEEPAAPYSGAVPPPPPLDRLSLQNQHPHLRSMEEECEKLIPHQQQHQQQQQQQNTWIKEIVHNNNNNPSFLAKKEEEQQVDDDADDRIRHGIALFVAEEEEDEGNTTTTHKMLTTTMANNREPDATESTHECTQNSDDELDRQLWHMAQQPSTSDQQRLQVYWNLCYPHGATTTTTTTTSSGKTGAVQPSKSCLNKRSHRTATQTTSSPNERNTDSTRATTPPLPTTAAATTTEHSPARKKTHQTTNTTSLTTTATSLTVSSSTAIQFAPSSAVEFHEDAPVHEWRVLEDAAQRFPTSGASQSDEDEDETKPSESTWAALFALERENETNPERNQNEETGDDVDDDDESSLDGGLGRLVPCHGTVSAANQLQVSESSLLSSSDSSLNYTAPSRSSLTTNNNNTVLLADFQEGFRMNSDQSLGLHSVASSSVSDRSLTVNMAAAPRSSLTNHNNNNNNKSNHSTIPFAGFHEGFRMNSEQSLGLASSASSSVVSDRSLTVNLAAAPRSSLTINNDNTKNNHATMPFAGFHEGFRMNSDQSLGLASSASSVVSDRSLPLAIALAPPTRRSSLTTSKTIPSADWEEGFRMNSDQSLGFHSVTSSSSSANNKSGCLRDNDNNTDGWMVVEELLHSSRLRSVPSPTMMGMSTCSEYYFKQPRGSRNLMASSCCCLPRDEEATVEPPAASLSSSSGCNRSGL